MTTRKRTPQKVKQVRKSQRPSAAPADGPPPDSERPTREIPITLDEPLASVPPPRESRPTLTDETELERARLRSLQLSAFPPERASYPGVEPMLPILSMANAAAPSIPPDDEAPPPTPTAPPPPEAQRAVERERSGDPLVDMRDRHSLGDYTGALAIAEQILGEDPVNAEALACAESCREVLVKMYSARIGPLDRVPVVAVARNQLRWLSLDHRAGFVLSHIDGTSSLEMILDVSGMAPLDCLRILYELVQQRVIAFR